MNHTDSLNPESNNNLDEWKSWPPDAVLHAVMSELKSPLTSIKGYAQLLSNESTKEFHSKYLVRLKV
jgi:nitrogen-specific signal transduction histidine kinase